MVGHHPLEVAMMVRIHLPQQCIGKSFLNFIRSLVSMMVRLPPVGRNPSPPANTFFYRMRPVCISHR